MDILAGSDHIAALTLALIAIATTVVQGMRARDKSNFEFSRLQTLSRELEIRMDEVEKNIDRQAGNAMITDKDVDMLKSAMQNIQASTDKLSSKLNDFAVEFAKSTTELHTMIEIFKKAS